MLKLIVAGTGRSGTVYIAKLLTSLGLPCGHESVFDQQPLGIIIDRINNPKKRVLSQCSMGSFLSNKKSGQWVEPSTIVADSSYLVVPHLNLDEIKDIPLVHIVREPKQVIRSFVYDFGYFSGPKPNKKNLYNKLNWEGRIYEFLPALSDITTPLERAAYFYYNWNMSIEKQKNKRPYYFSQLETLDKEKLCHFVGVEFKDNTFNDTKANSNKRQDIDFEIPSGKIKDDLDEMAARYGYGN